MKYFLLLLSLLVFVTIREVYSVMTENQLKAAIKMTRNVCQPKTKAPMDEIAGMREGKWDISHNTMCFMHCTLNTYKLQSKDNSLNFEEAVKTTEKKVPLARQPISMKAMNDCRYSAKTLNDKCIAAYEIAKCIYESSPTNYFLS